MELPAWVTLHYDMDIILHLCLTLTSKWGAAALARGGRREGADSLRLQGLHFQVGGGEEEEGVGHTDRVRLIKRSTTDALYRYYRRGKAKLADILLLVVGRRQVRYIWWSGTLWELVAPPSLQNRMMSFQAASFRFSQFKFSTQFT